MTEEDFEKQMRALNKKEIEIARQKYELKKQYLEEYPIRINDKVDCNEKACWVSNIRFTTLQSTSIYFLVSNPKKDGTRSNREQCAWGVIKV